MTIGNRIVLFLLRAERARLAGIPGKAFRVVEICTEIERRILR